MQSGLADHRSLAKLTLFSTARCGGCKLHADAFGEMADHSSLHSRQPNMTAQGGFYFHADGGAR